jgi:hypothetical protein
MAATRPIAPADPLKKLITGEWVIDRTTAEQRRVIHYWATLLWFTVGLVTWIALRDALWFVGFMSLYAIWVTHLAGWAAETPVEPGDEGAPTDRGSPDTAEVDTADSLAHAEPN